MGVCDRTVDAHGEHQVDRGLVLHQRAPSQAQRCIAHHAHGSEQHGLQDVLHSRVKSRCENVSRPGENLGSTLQLSIAL